MLPLLVLSIEHTVIFHKKIFARCHEQYSWTWYVSELKFVRCIHPAVDVLSLNASKYTIDGTLFSSMSTKIVIICAINSSTLFASNNLNNGGV